MRCAACGQENVDGQKSCTNCGTALGRECVSCGFQNSTGMRYCGSCGNSLTPIPPPSAAPKVRIPESFVGGRYRVIKPLGEGGSKTVYLARDVNLDREVAFALIRTPGLDAAGRERISREARAMGRLGDHPHIVTVYDVGEEQNHPYIVSQYMAGGSVEDLLEHSEEHRLPIADAVRIADEVSQALEHAHSVGIVHRDIKPANVWLGRDGRSRLGDFGLAIARDLSRLTASGVMVGTVAYIAPEQVQGKTPEPRSDLYSLGAMLYEMLTGHPPFKGGDLVTIITQHLQATPEPPSKDRRDVTRELDALVLELLAKKPEGRPASAAVVHARLQSIANNLGSAIDQLAKSVAIERPNLSMNAAADGTVSILFSDIENSTALYDRLGDVRAQELMHLHNTMIREQVAANRGREVKSMGDGFMVVFASARRALQCAIAIQRAFAAYSEKHKEQPLRVRIGLHVGEAIKESDDFFGTAVIMAARVGAKAEGGEILVSNVFKAVAGSAGDVEFGEGQDVALKGFSGVHKVYRVFWNEKEKPCPSCSKPIPSDSRSCPHCTLPLGFDQPPALTEQFDAPRSTISAAQPSRASTIARVAVAAIALVALGALAIGSFQYSQVLKERRIALEHLEQEKQAAAAAEQHAREESDKLKQQEDQAKAAADAERAKQEEAKRQEEEHKKQLAEAKEKERQAKLKAEQDAAEKAKAEATAQEQSASQEQATAQDGASAPAPDAAATTTASAKPPRGKHARLAKASLPKGKYHIDVDGVRERADAEALAGKLQKLGFTAYLVPSEDDDGLWVVRVGPFRTQDEADAAERDMTAKYAASFKTN